MLKMKWLVSLAIASASIVSVVSVVSVASVARAANPSPEDTIKARQSNLKDIGGAFKAVRDQLRLSTPNMPAIKQAAQQIKDLAADQVHWFPKGTGPETGVKTAAKPEIWSDPQGFSEVLNKFSVEAPKLSAYAEANDLAGLKAQVLTVGQACKGCHDKYRVPQD
jgi:cytochrome c556